MYRIFAAAEGFSDEFQQKLESLLEADLEKKKSTLAMGEVVPMLECLG